MPSLSQHHSSNLIKLLLLGDAKSGKTTALASLVTHLDLKLRILDFDNLLDTLAMRIRAEAPERMDNVEFRSMRDKWKGSDAGMLLEGKAKAWTDSLKMLNQWKYGDIDLGKPADWGPDCVLVIDSLSRMCDAAYDYHSEMAGAKADGRAVYGNAQDDVERQLANLTHPNFETNVIVVCHGNYMAQPDSTTKIFPQGVGQKLSPKIPQYFPNYIRMTKRAEVRTLQLASDNMIDLANTRPDVLGKDLSPETGLAEFFGVLRNTPLKGVPTAPKPKSVTLVRRS